MPGYTINRYKLLVDPDSKFPFTINNNTIENTKTSLGLLGEGIADYGQTVAEDLVYLLENFAGPTPPANKITGQLWYDSQNAVIRINLGTVWNALGTVVTNGTQPTGPSVGDLWYNIPTQTLSCWDGTQWFPISTEGTGAQEQTNNGHTFLALEVNGQDVAIFSTASFTPNPAIPGFPEIFGGMTLSTNNTYNGISGATVLPLTDATYNLGSPTQNWLNIYADSIRALTGISSATILPLANATYNLGSLGLQWQNIYGVNGFFSGNLQVLGTTTSGTNVPLANNLYNLGSSALRWQTGYFNNLDVAGSITGSLVPSADSMYNLGSPSDQWENLYAVNGTFSGSLTVDGPIIAPGGYQDILPSTTGMYVVGNPTFQWENGNFINLVVGDLTAQPGGSTVTGTWTLNPGATWNATYADIAEKFEADTDDLSVGTLVSIGGTKDITRTQEDCSPEVFGIVSDSAAFRMNSELGEGNKFPFIALSGTVPVKVVGKVVKGQRLVSSEIPGYARAITNNELFTLGEKAAFVVIGRALENKETEGMGLLERTIVNMRV